MTVTTEKSQFLFRPSASVPAYEAESRVSAVVRTMSATSLSDRTCLVTGSSRGIGAAIARELGAHGAAVAVNYRSSPKAADEVVDAIIDAGGEASAFQADVARIDEVKAMAEAVRDEYGSLDILVNNAGITKDTRFDRMSQSDWEDVVNVNVNGMFYCTSAFCEDLIGSDYGRLINISSVVGQQGNYGQANYAATKSAMIGFTRSIAREFGRFGTTANCIAPGFTKTDMLHVVEEEIQEKIRQKIPLGRFAEVEDIAGAARFLAGPDGAYITGEVLSINGGISI